MTARYSFKSELYLTRNYRCVPDVEKLLFSDMPSIKIGRKQLALQSLVVQRYIENNDFLYGGDRLRRTFDSKF